jgi:hypothetical protein
MTVSSSNHANTQPESAAQGSQPGSSAFDGDLFDVFFEGVVEAFQESDWMTERQASDLLSNIPASQIGMILNDAVNGKTPDSAKNRYRRPVSSGPKVIQASGYFYSDEPKMIG